MLDELKPPGRVVTNAASWGFPRRCTGTTLINSEWLTLEVKQWVMDAANGDVIDARTRVAGLGLNAVGSNDDVEEFFSALLNDLVRQPATKDWVINPEFARFYTLHQIHLRVREDYQAVEAFNSHRLLFVTQIDVTDKWACNTLTDILAMRLRLGRPTMVGLSTTAFDALYPQTEEQACAHYMLKEALEHSNIYVELG